MKHELPSDETIEQKDHPSDLTVLQDNLSKEEATSESVTDRVTLTCWQGVPVNFKSILKEVAIACPPIADAAGFSIISFSELLTTLNASGVAMGSNTLSPFWLFLAAAPLLGSLGVVAIGIAENKRHADEVHAETRSQKLLYLAKKHPAELTLAMTAAVAEGIIVLSNINSAVDQFGMPEESPFVFYPGVIVSTLTGLQFLMMYINWLVKLTQKGYQATIDYTHHFANKPWLRLATMGIVNGLPMLASLTFGALAASESYHLMQYGLKFIEGAHETTYEAVVDQVAWIPTTVFGLIYSTCQLSFYGSHYKQFLAEKVYELSVSGFKTFIKDNLIPNSEITLKKVLGYPIALNIALLGGFIAFGALTTMSYLLAHGDLPEEDSDIKISRSMQLSFIPLAINLAMAVYSLESRQWLNCIGIRTTNEIIDAANQITSPSNQTSYSIDRLSIDTLQLALIASVKLGIEWITTPQDLSWKENVTTGLIVGLFATLSNGAGYLYQKQYTKEQAPTTTGNGDKDIQVMVPANEVRNTISQKEFAARMLFTLVSVGGISFLTQQLVQEVMLGSITDENDAAVDNAQFLSAIAAGIIGVVTKRFVMNASSEVFTNSFQQCKNGASAIISGCVSFFSGFGGAKTKKATDRTPLLNNAVTSVALNLS